MCSIQNVTRKQGIYYFRRLVRLGDGKPFRLRFSLRTTSRRRAILLAPALTLIAERLALTMKANFAADGLTGAQRAEIFRRQMLVERDRLEVMHATLHFVPRDDNPDPEDALALRLGASELAASDGIAKGVVEDFLVARIDIDDDDAPIELLAWSDIAASIGDEGVDAEAVARLADLGIQPSQLRQVMARKVVHQARLSSLEEFRRVLVDPATAYAPVPFAAIDRSTPDLSSPPAAACTSASSSSPWQTMTATEAALKFFDHNPRTGGQNGASAKRGRKSWTGKTCEQFLLAAKFLEEVMAGRPLATVTHEDLVALDRCFVWIHAPSFRKSDKDRQKTIVEIAAETEAAVIASESGPTSGKRSQGGEQSDKKIAVTRDAVGLSVPTTNRHWGFLRQLTRWFDGHQPLPKLDYSAFISQDERHQRDMRERLTLEQGRAIFALPPWTGCKSLARRMLPGTLIVHDAFYWVPLIAWYAGLRRDEICGLELADIACVDGHWQFIVQPNSVRPLKTVSSQRIVPMASELVRLGLPAYVDALRKEGETLLFPELRAGSSKSSMGDVFYKRAWTKMAPKIPDLTDKQSIHSFRHTAIDCMKGAGISEEIRADFAGHSQNGETKGRYSKAHLDLLREAVAAIPEVTTELIESPLTILPSLRRRL